MRTSRQLWHLRPRTAASADFFVAVKDGDYDGRLFVVSKDGEVADLIGGSYFITADHEFLVSEYSSDLHAIVVFDLGENRKVLESRNIAEIDTWCRDDATSSRNTASRGMLIASTLRAAGSTRFV